MDKQEKLKAVISLIVTHFEGDEIRFREVAEKIANHLDGIGKGELAMHIYAQMGYGNTFSPGGGELPTPEEQVLIKLIDEFEDAVWCSRGDVLKQNDAAKKRAASAKKSLKAIFDTYANRRTKYVLNHIKHSNMSIDDAIERYS